MTKWYLPLIALILIAAVLFAGCLCSPPATPAITAPVAAPVKITDTKDLIAYVSHAAAFAREHGRGKALAAFNDPNDSFVSGNLHIFAVDYEGNLLADPFEPGSIGTDILDLTDSFGTPLVRNLGETARFGRGYVSYSYPNPARDSEVEQKISVVEDVDGTYYVAGGIYASDADIYPSTVLDTKGADISEDDLVAFVKGAVAYAREHGKEKALAAFNDPKGQFVRGQLVVMAFDYNGTNLASPPYASEVAANRINLINYHDPDGVDTIRGMRDIARDGGGFFYTVARVKVEGKEVYLPKIDYTEPVDGEWWLFSGIIDPQYAPVVSGNIAGIPTRSKTRVELYDLVNRAVAYAKEDGKEKTLAAINDPNGPFIDGNFFVWASSTDGVLLADPYWKTGVGQNYLDYTDLYGLKITRVGIEAMQNGTGFSHALFPDTAVNGTAWVPKLVYQKAVDDSWWIGSGVYGVEVK